MEMRQLTSRLSVCAQINVEDIEQISAAGIKTIICNRPDNEGEDQPASEAIREACEAAQIKWHYLPVSPKDYTDAQGLEFGELVDQAQEPILAFCRTGTRCTNLWALSQAGRTEFSEISSSAKEAGYDVDKLNERVSALAESVAAGQASDIPQSEEAVVIGSHQVVIIGGGAGGQSTAASLLKRNPKLDIAIIEPSTEHYYQPGWTMVGGGIFEAPDTVRKMVDVMPDNVKWYQIEVDAFLPDNQQVVLANGELIHYQYLVVAPGLTLNWGAIEGLEETLGSNGVTSNYRFDLAPYTWDLVQKTQKGKAIFTQPPMPIKCAGAPQKAMYLACSKWLSESRLNSIDVEFCNAGPALFGVADYVPALMEYVEKYKIELSFSQNLIKVDGPNQTATFMVTDAEGNKQEVEKQFDMLHVCPVQCAPKFISESPLSDAAGWVDLDPQTLQHKKYHRIFGVGDANNTANAKTAAAVRKQAPVVAENILSAMAANDLDATYDGYGSCPLTVEHGKIVLAEFGYGGKLLPSLPLWLIEGKRPSKLSWILKAKILPWLYWNGMLKGKEWLAAPGRKSDS
jgi:sulfide:quinone oxidoreductase